jgi:hypothetical protein
MITMGLAVQPDVLQSLSNTPAFRGRGLIGRFAFALPKSLIGTRMYRNRPRNPDARRNYCGAIYSLLMMKPPIDPDGNTGLRHRLKIEGKALETWAEYADAVERRQLEGMDLSGITDFASKLAGTVARIAGGFHLVVHAFEPEPWREPISEETILRAWTVGEYLIPHALAAYSQMGVDASQGFAKRILEWIKRHALTQFTFRECHQGFRASSRAEIEQGLNMLIDRGYIRAAPVDSRSGAGRPKSPVFEVNTLAQNTQNTQN